MVNVWKNRLQRFLFEECCYSIGIRRRSDKLLYEGNKAVFKIMPINRHEWYADPLVFHYKMDDWLFCEVFDRDCNKGRIGVAKLDSDNPQKPRIVLDIDSHLSYPCVFQKDGEVYMIPETTTRRNIMLFRSISFPDKWEQVGEILSGGEFADTTVFQDGKHTFLFTFEQYEGNGSITRIHVLDASQGFSSNLTEIAVGNDDFSDQLRGGGNFFYANGKLMRPSQDCEPYYGYGLNFMEVDSVFPVYKERLVKKVTPTDIRGDIKYEIKGIHTYSLTNSYEVIDVMFDDVVFSHQIKRLFNFVKRSIKGGGEYDDL